jgi:hypothetical protein
MNAGKRNKRAGAAWPRRADQEEVLEGIPWSALQTHLQGVNWAVLAVMPEECRHRAAPLSRLNSIKIMQPVREGKPEPSAGTPEANSSRAQPGGNMTGTMVAVELAPWRRDQPPPPAALTNTRVAIWKALG